MGVCGGFHIYMLQMSVSHVTAERARFGFTLPTCLPWKCHMVLLLKPCAWSWSLWAVWPVLFCSTLSTPKGLTKQELWYSCSYTDGGEPHCSHVCPAAGWKMWGCRSVGARRLWQAPRWNFSSKVTRDSDWHGQSGDLNQQPTGYWTYQQASQIILVGCLTICVIRIWYKSEMFTSCLFLQLQIRCRVFFPQVKVKSQNSGIYIKHVLIKSMTSGPLTSHRCRLRLRCFPSA